MKRMLLIAAAALMFVNTIVVPTFAHADGDQGGTCGKTMCKP